MSNPSGQSQKETNINKNQSESEKHNSGSESSHPSNSGKHTEIIGVTKDSNGIIYYAITQGNKVPYKILSSDEMISRYPKLLISYLEGKVVFPQK